MLLILIPLGVCGYGIKYFNDLAFAGNESIMLVDGYEEILSLEELINKEEFKDKVIYIDVWGVYCRPCIDEFQHAVKLKGRYTNEPVAFLYLASPYNRINDEQKWKSAIKKYHLEGYHVLMNAAFYDEIWSEVPDMDDPYLIPHYLLVDRKGKVVRQNAPRPSDQQNLHFAIDQLLQ